MKVASSITFAVLIVGLPGCASVRNLFGLDGPPKTELESIEIIANQANLNSATQLDLVFVYEAAAAALLPSSALEWFATKAAVRAAAPTAIEIVPLQMLPTDIENVKLPDDADDAVDVRAYANYIPKGGHVGLNLTPLTRAVIHLESETVRVTEQ